MGFDPLRQPPGIARCNGRAHGSIRPARPGEQALLAEEHFLHLRIEADDDQHQVARARDLGGRRDDTHAKRGCLLARRRRRIIATNSIALGDEVPRHRPSHGAQTDDPDPLHHCDPATPALSMILPQRATSEARKFFSSAGGGLSTEWCRDRSFACGCPAARGDLQLGMQPLDDRLRRPCRCDHQQPSDEVEAVEARFRQGRDIGAAGTRVSELTPSAFTLPSAICCNAVPVSANIRGHARRSHRPTRAARRDTARRSSSCRSCSGTARRRDGATNPVRSRRRKLTGLLFRQRNQVRHRFTPAMSD